MLDGELLVRGSDQGVADVHGGAAASFNALQQRLGRKNVSQKMLGAYPAFVRLYDILFDGDEDLRELPWERAARRGSKRFASALDPERFDVSQLIEAKSFEELEDLRANARDVAIEGIMLKRRDSPYVAGRRAGLWYKWKRDPLTADCVLMYAQRGSGKRSSYYSDYTFGCWTEEGELLPVGKAYFGFTDEELKWLDRWIRGHTVERFGPVREVEKSLVLEVAFDSIHKSTRHKSGLAMRFPRISRIRTDKPAAEADRIADPAVTGNLKRARSGAKPRLLFERGISMLKHLLAGAAALASPRPRQRRNLRDPGRPPDRRRRAAGARAIRP